MHIDTEQTQNDYWAQEDFEDTVSDALIACFETKIRKNKGAAPADRLTEKNIRTIRSLGPYVPSRSRILIAPGDINDQWHFDIDNDVLPKSGLCAFKPAGKVLESRPGSYMILDYIRQVNNLGKFWRKLGSGTLFEFYAMHADNRGIGGERRFFTVSRHGDVSACTQEIPNNRGYQPGRKVERVSPDNEWFNETMTWASVALQLTADRHYCWTITAREKYACVHVGCMIEEIKSLLYARELPMTSTGRKRPILHLVESHKRRLRNGVDIDITSFLRGQQTIEIAGTIFTVSPPSALKHNVTVSSQKRYF